MDKNTHIVTLPVKDYEELLERAKYSPEEIKHLENYAVNVIRFPRARSVLSITTAVPDWFNLRELQVVQHSNCDRLVKRYKLVEVSEDEMSDMRKGNN